MKYFIIIVLSLSALAYSKHSFSEAITGEAELGFSSFTGNSTSNNLNVLLSFEKHSGKWLHNFDLEAIRNSNNGDVEAQNYTLDLKSDYFYKQQTYGFYALRYERDRFNSFEYQSSLSFGFGTRLIENDQQDLDVSIGLGLKKSKENQTNILAEETIIRFGAEYLYQITDNTQLLESLLIEVGEENTQSNSVTSLKTYLSDRIALKLSLTIKNNSLSIVGKEKTDTQTNVSIGYSF